MSNAPRPSTSSLSSYPASPTGSPNDASAPLILVHDPEEPIDPPFDFSSDSEDEQIFNPPFDGRSPIIPPLSPSAVFLYLLSPYLKLGAMLLPNENLSIKRIVPPLLFFAALSAFSRHILYLLARYLRKFDLDDMISNAFVRGRGNERRREIVKNVCRFSTGCLRVLLGTIYLRESSHILLSLLPETLSSQVALNLLLAFLIIPLSVVHSLSAKPIIYMSWASVATYVVWLGCTCYSHTRGTLAVNPTWLPMGTLWQGITTIAFAFASPSPLRLYASLKAAVPHVTTKTPKYRSFKTLSALSVIVALALILPLAFFSYHPESQEQHDVFLQSFMAILSAVTLVLSIPSILIITPSIPLPKRIRTKYCLSRAILYLVMLFLTLIPAPIPGILSNALLILALSATYLVPAIVHIKIHQFSRPLSIIVPTTHHTGRPDSPSQDELLQRKERALQKGQKMKRLAWDIGVWILLVPVGGGGLLWGAGKLAGRW